MPGGTILIVDDEADVRNSLAQLLGAELPDVTIHTASGPQEALAFLAERHADVMLVDYRMPSMDGLELLARVAPEHPDTVAILITAFPSLDLALRAVNDRHVRFFMTKPFRHDEMVGAVAEALDEHRQTVA